jgi:hypothetical protein
MCEQIIVNARFEGRSSGNAVRPVTVNRESCAIRSADTGRLRGTKAAVCVSDAKDADQGCQGGCLLPTARIIKKEAGIRLTPVLKHTEKSPFGKMLGDI